MKIETAIKWAQGITGTALIKIGKHLSTAIMLYLHNSNVNLMH